MRYEIWCYIGTEPRIVGKFWLHSNAHDFCAQLNFAYSAGLTAARQHG